MPKNTPGLVAKHLGSKPPGRYGDGGGLYFHVRDTGSRAWVFRYRDRVTAKLRDKGFAEADLTAIDQHLPLQVIPFSADHARLAANLRPATRATRLPLGDRCCLALAQALPGAQVVTADRAWAGLAGFDIALLR